MEVSRPWIWPLRFREDSASVECAYKAFRRSRATVSSHLNEFARYAGSKAERTRVPCTLYIIFT